ncbi:MAG: hypothetical protein JWQ27_1345 [Ferruginibacter sp.]|nr:hypothetical protein [Ferruginibacter sp.]
MQKQSGLLALLFIAAAFSSCKKSQPDLVSNLASDTTHGTSSAAQIKDSALLLSRDVYLWDNQIPASFNAQNYADPAAIMKAIQPFSIEPGFTQAVDRWSFAMKKTEWNQMAGGMSTLSSSASANGDFGLSVFFRAEGDLRVRLVEPASPAGRAGIKRGWRILSVNGNSSITTSNASMIVSAVYESDNTSFSFQKPDGTVQNLSLQAGHYTEKPVYLDTVYTAGSRKVGYLVFNSFLGNTANIASEFQRVFSKFSAAGVSKLIVDLRYNGGGYVSVAEQLANYLVVPSANGGTMMTQQYNSRNSQSNEVTMFHKTGSLNIPDVYFIVGRGTASASELLINNLKPYMDVKLVGASATHGKPVGFFPLAVGDWYVFPVSFRTINKNGEGNYFNGLPVNAQVADGLDKDWGDITETSLSYILTNISSGAFRTATYNEPATVVNGNNLLNETSLKVTIGTRKP